MAGKSKRYRSISWVPVLFLFVKAYPVFAAGPENNTPPIMSLQPPISEQSGDIVVGFTLRDTQSDRCSLRSIIYSIDDGTHWAQATVTGDTSDLVSSPEGVYHTIIWNSALDILGEDVPDCRLSVTPNDGWTEGLADTTEAFHVDNNLPPSIDLIHSSGRREDIIVVFSLADPEVQSPSSAPPG